VSSGRVDRRYRFFRIPWSGVPAGGRVGNLRSEKNYREGFELGEGPFNVRAVLLRELAGTLHWPTQPGLTFMHELEGRIRVICGLGRSPILTEGDEALRDHVGAGSNDSVLLVWGPGEDTLQAAEEIRIRYADASEGVPNETRQYQPDGSTDFERILAGPDRMYPDTDARRRRSRPRVSRICGPLWWRRRGAGKSGTAKPACPSKRSTT